MRGADAEPAGAAASDVYVDVSQVVTYKLTHRTVVELDGPVEFMRVYHARPVEPAWIENAMKWVIEPVFDPAGADWQPAPQGGSYWRWERSDLEPSRHAFESRFDVVTARRESAASATPVVRRRGAGGAAAHPQR